jgi:flagellar biosynthesis/type III secretory pathway M-ring protein FliF/YscJ
VGEEEPGRSLQLVEILLVLLIVGVVAWFVSAPLRRSDEGSEAADASTEDPAIAALEARKEAKYREIRDAELDREQGKLSADDWRHQDAELRREAIEILKALDQARRSTPDRPPA